MAVPLSTEKIQLIEKLGMHNENSGIQPAAARIFALLIVSDRNELSFEEIYDTLKISKSATSSAINLLIGTQRVEYITKPGERKRYFRCKVKSLNIGVERHLQNIEVFNALLKRVLFKRPEGTREFNDALKEVIGFLDFMGVELPVLYQKWEDLKK